MRGHGSGARGRQRSPGDENTAGLEAQLDCLLDAEYCIYRHWDQLEVDVFEKRSSDVWEVPTLPEWSG